MTFSGDTQRSGLLGTANRESCHIAAGLPAVGLTTNPRPLNEWTLNRRQAGGYMTIFRPPFIFPVLLIDRLQEQMYSYSVAGAPVPVGTERGGVFLFSFHAGCRTKRETMRALRAAWAYGRSCDGSGRRWRSSSKVFLTSRPGGTSGRLTETKNAGAASFGRVG
jgi:hypothetical protein